MLLHTTNVTFIWGFLLVLGTFANAGDLEFKYHNNTELENVLKDFLNSGSYRLRKNLYSIGKSSGRPKSGIKPSSLWVFELTAAEEERIGIPNVKLIGNVHGTETAGREILLHLIEYLIREYEEDDMVTFLLDNTRIHIMPSLNPDGFTVANKYFCLSCSSCLGIGVTDDDTVITSNFPDYFHTNEVLEHAAETLAVMKWMEDYRFILSGSFFGSFLVAIYPYCNKNETRIENPTPDDDVFQHLAKTYANNHATMYKGPSCPSSNLHFDSGIINGASWHNHDADMTDYNYIFRGCMEVRFEISCCKYPDPGELEGIWNDNKNAILKYIMQANKGVTGQILDVDSKKPVEASMKVIGRNIEFGNFKSTGEFWRILLPGQYILQIEADGYYTQMQNFTVEDYGDNYPKLTHLNVFMLNSSVLTSTASTTQIPTTTERITSTTTRKTTQTNTFYQSLLAEETTTKSFGNRFESNLLLITLVLLVILTLFGK